MLLEKSGSYFGLFLALILAVVQTKGYDETAKITRFHSLTTIQLRYAITKVEATIKNFHNEASDVSYDMYIPHEAFVSNFSMVLKNETFLAKVESKENATKIFDESNSTRGIVNVNKETIFKEGQHVSFASLKSLYFYLYIFFRSVFLPKSIPRQKLNLC